MTFRVYVASRYANAPAVREVHERLLASGITPTSAWATHAGGAEDFAKYDETQLRAFAAENDRCIDSSDAVLVLSMDGCGETYAEAARGLLHGLPLFWVGRRTLSAWRQGVTRCEDLDDALALLVGAAEGR